MHPKDELRDKAEKELTSRAMDFTDLGLEDAQRQLHELYVHQVELEMQNEELRKTQAELEESRNRYVDLYEFAPVGYLTVDEEGLILEANLPLAQLFHVERRNLIGKRFQLFIALEHRIAFRQYLKEIVKCGEQRTCEVELIQHSNKQCYVQLDGIAVKAAEGALRINMSATDISGRKLAEQQLRESEQKYRAVSDNIAVGVALISPKMEVLSLNRQMREWFPDIDVTKKPICYEAFHSPPREGLCPYCPACKTLKDGKIHEAISETPTRDGIRNYKIVSSPIKDRDGKIMAALEAVGDVTEARQREEQRQKTIELLHLLNSSWDTGSLIGSVTTFLQECSGCKAVGVRLSKGDDFTYFEAKGFPEEFILAEDGLCTVDREGSLLRDSEGRPVLECMCGNVIRGRIDPSKPFFTEYGSFWTNSTTDLVACIDEADRQGTTRNRCNTDGYESVALIPLRSGEETLGLLQFNDEQKGRFTPALISFLESLAESIAAALSRWQAREDRSRLIAAVEQSAEGIMITDIDGTIHYVNPAFEKITGYSKEEAVGGNPRTLRSGGHDKSFYERLWDTFNRGEVWKGQFVNKRKNGGLYEEETTISPVRNDSGQIVGYIAVRRDITREVRLEQQLRQAQKMEALGTLAGGIAHDFNNILGVIMGYTQIMQFDIEDGSPLGNSLESVLVASHRAKDLVQQILAFSRQSKQERIAMQIAPILKEALKMLRASLPSTIEIQDNIKGKISAVLADPTQVHQVLMNLCTNAAHAMREKGGILSVELSNVEVDASLASRYPELKPGLYVKLSVGDTGHGMERSVIERVFDPYFTTKPKGVGTGLGLAVVDGIMRACGGAISIDSEPGKGTTFDLFFPGIQNELLQKAEDFRAIPGGHERILLVDDESAIVDMVRQMLERLGYEVISRTSSKEALEAFKRRQGEIDLVITDMTMPHMPGTLLAEEIWKIRPDIPVILCTGFSEPITREKAMAMSFRELLMKPVLLRDLGEAIRRALSGALK